MKDIIKKIGAILKNLFNILKPRQVYGRLVGIDHFGNKYYEIPANLSLNKIEKSRWFDPNLKENFEQDLPIEWVTWLCGNRNEPPTLEEMKKYYISTTVSEPNLHGSIFKKSIT